MRASVGAGVFDSWVAAEQETDAAAAAPIRISRRVGRASIWMASGHSVPPREREQARDGPPLSAKLARLHATSRRPPTDRPCRQGNGVLVRGAITPPEA